MIETSVVAPRPARPTLPAEFPRARRAWLWTSLWCGGTLFADALVDLGRSRPLVDAHWIRVLVIMGCLFTAILGLASTKQAGRYPRMLLLGLGLVLMASLLEFGPRSIFALVTSSDDSQALLESPPTAEDSSDWSGTSILDWDDDIVAWCIASQAQTQDATRAARIAALSQALETIYSAGGFVPHDTQAAAADAGAITPAVATALLTSPRGREPEDYVPTPLEAAQVWVAGLPRTNIGDGHEYATARAILVLFPEMEGLRDGLDKHLLTGLPLPGTSHAVSSLRNAVVLADMLDLRDRAEELRERSGQTLNSAWVDTSRFASTEVGFARSPEKHFDLADAIETHAAIQLMARCGVPEGIDLNRQRRALDWRAVDFRWSDRNERIVARLDGRFMDQTWPDESGRRPGVSDVVLLALLVVIVWSVYDIRRQPLERHEPSA